MTQAQSLSSNIAPHTENSIEASLDAVVKSYFLHHDGATYAKVISYDRATNRATLQPLNKGTGSDGKPFSRFQIPDVPVLTYGCSGYFVSLPVTPGTVGLLVAGDRDPSNYKEANPNAGNEYEPRNLGVWHQFTYGTFIPMVFAQTINGADSGAVTIQNTAADTRIALQNNKVTITVPGSTITINGGAVTIQTATATVNATSAVNITTPTATVTGNLVVTGTASFNGGTSIAANGDLTVGGIAYKTHKHTGVQKGNDTSGGPTN